MSFINPPNPGGPMGGPMRGGASNSKAALLRSLIAGHGRAGRQSGGLPGVPQNILNRGPGQFGMPGGVPGPQDMSPGHAGLPMPTDLGGLQNVVAQRVAQAGGGMGQMAGNNVNAASQAALMNALRSHLTNLIG